MFVCTCCGKWEIAEITYELPHRTVLRIKHYGYVVREVKTIYEVAEILERFGVRLEDLEER